MNEFGSYTSADSMENSRINGFHFDSNAQACQIQVVRAFQLLSAVAFFEFSRNAATFN